MWRKFCNWLLYKHWGWTSNVTENHPAKFIICLAPHTSNWDFVLGQLYSGAMGIRIGFLMKKEWFFWPLGPIFRKMGGIPVYRSKHSRMTDALADAARNADHFALCITPEGTRSPNSDWKKGFYWIAKEAGIPILLYAADYEKKVIRCTKQIIPNGNIDDQMKEIKEYYVGCKGKHPENFVM